MALVKCVKCGGAVDVQRYIHGMGIEYPPACDKHQQEVQEETDMDLPFWPSDWHGDCWKHDTQGWMVKVSSGKVIPAKILCKDHPNHETS